MHEFLFYAAILTCEVLWIYRQSQRSSSTKNISSKISE